MMSPIDPEIVGGFLAFMDSEFVKYPHCDRLIKCDEMEKIVNKQNNAIQCPHCKVVVPINKLIKGLG